MLDPLAKGLTLEEGKYVEMLDTLVGEPIPEQGMIEVILDPRIKEPKSQSYTGCGIRGLSSGPEGPHQNTAGRERIKRRGQAMTQRLHPR